MIEVPPGVIIQATLGAFIKLTVILLIRMELVIKPEIIIQFMRKALNRAGIIIQLTEAFIRAGIRGQLILGFIIDAGIIQLILGFIQTGIIT
mmetsp:Transcript_21282/g.9802  ORF Transcript_21282/g.9802 Transcript_21282/m.9802 type:complete len:92 (+) Transcript_21282:21-296(+)